ncbi:Aspartate carbamoyltransferase regulatory chain [Sodalis praecaptivus]
MTEEQANQLAIYAPHATVNRIDNYDVVRKQTLQLPERIDGVLTCPNSNCISRSEPVASGFRVKVRGQQVHLQCKHCEKEFEHQAVIQSA